VSRPVLDRAPYDLIVIGAGVNGLGVAQDAALRGLRVVLLEKEDLCSGVSAWSGRLVHGGLRYLEQYDFRLVRESLRERERLFRLAPHLVKPVPLMMPMYQHNRRSSWLVELGMLTYDVLSLRKKPPTHRVLTRRRALKRFPGMSQSGLSGAAVFFDGQVEYAERLCVELAVDAQRNGAHILTHAQVTDPILEGGRVVGVRYTDHLTGNRGEVRGAVVLNVAGPWIDRVFTSPDVPDQPRLNGGTKGSHLIVGPFPGAPKDVVYYESRKDGRLVLVIPWLGRYMLGTTDIRFEEDPDGARCDIGEAEYLMGEVNSLVPNAKLTLDDVLYTFSGVRPLPYVPDSAESSVPRTHILYDHSKTGLPGVVTVVGGKLSTYRQLAEDAVDDAYRRLARKPPRCPTRNRPLPGAQVSDLRALHKTLTVRSGLPDRSVRRLVSMYGSRALDVWRLAERDAGLGRVIDADTGLLAAEVVFSVGEELATTLTDVMARRLILAFEPDHGLSVMSQVVDILRARLGWDEDMSAAQIAEYQHWLDRLAVPDPAGPRSDSFGAGVVVKER
jgi:glycerol-3-phosphate dehydrogenase